MLIIFLPNSQTIIWFFVLVDNMRLIPDLQFTIKKPENAIPPGTMNPILIFYYMKILWILEYAEPIRMFCICNPLMTNV